MCKKLQLLRDEVPQTPYGVLPLDHTGGLPILPDTLAALTGNESVCFSLRLCLVTTSAARQTPGGPAIRGTDSWLDDTD